MQHPETGCPEPEFFAAKKFRLHRDNNISANRQNVPFFDFSGSFANMIGTPITGVSSPAVPLHANFVMPEGSLPSVCFTLAPHKLMPNYVIFT